MLRFVVLSLLAVASAVVHDGNCPDWKGVENFNMTAFQGTWYTISKLPYEDDKKGKCTAAEYKLDGESFKIRSTYVLNGVQNFLEGTAIPAADAKKAGKLAMSLKFADKTQDYPLLVLDTDYSNYAILYNCRFDEANKKHYAFAFVLSRTKKLEGAAKTAVDNFLKDKSKEIDSSKLIQVDFSDEACKFTSSAPVKEPVKA